MALIILLVNILIRILIVFYMWNVVMPPIFGLPDISVWQAIGLVILSNSFFNYSKENISLENKNEHNRAV